MPVQEIPEIIKTAVTLIPALRNLPILGRIIPLFQVGDMNDARAIEQFEAQREKNKQTRKKLKDDHNKRVIKINDAMQCVEDNIYDGKLALALAKGLVAVITQANPPDAGDILFKNIADCMVKKALQQKNGRKLGSFITEKGIQEPYREIIKLRRGKLHPFLEQI